MPQVHYASASLAPPHLFILLKATATKNRCACGLSHAFPEIPVRGCDILLALAIINHGHITKKVLLIVNVTSEQSQNAVFKISRILQLFVVHFVLQDYFKACGVQLSKVTVLRQKHAGSFAVHR